MPASFAFSKASVSGTDISDATVVVRQGVLTATARRGGTELLRVEGVTRVEELGRDRRGQRQVKVTTEDGEYVVTRAKGCGCGR